jgi:hypothetical protein
VAAGLVPLPLRRGQVAEVDDAAERLRVRGPERFLSNELGPLVERLGLLEVAPGDRDPREAVEGVRGDRRDRLFLGRTLRPQNRARLVEVLLGAVELPTTEVEPPEAMEDASPGHPVVGGHDLERLGEEPLGLRVVARRERHLAEPLEIHRNRRMPGADQPLPDLQAPLERTSALGQATEATQEHALLLVRVGHRGVLLAQRRLPQAQHALHDLEPVGGPPDRTEQVSEALQVGGDGQVVGTERALGHRHRASDGGLGLGQLPVGHQSSTEVLEVVGQLVGDDVRVLFVQILGAFQLPLGPVDIAGGEGRPSPLGELQDLRLDGGNPGIGPRVGQLDEAAGEALVAPLQGEAAVRLLELGRQLLAIGVVGDVLDLHLVEVARQVATLKAVDVLKGRLEGRLVAAEVILGRAVAPVLEQLGPGRLDSRREREDDQRAEVGGAATILGGVPDKVQDALEALEVGGEDGHQQLRHEHGADAAGVGEPGSRVDQDIGEPLGQLPGKGRDQLWHALVEEVPAEPADPPRIALIEASRRHERQVRDGGPDEKPVQANGLEDRVGGLLVLVGPLRAVLAGGSSSSRKSSTMPGCPPVSGRNAAR